MGFLPRMNRSFAEKPAKGGERERGWSGGSFYYTDDKVYQLVRCNAISIALSKQFLAF